MSGDLEYTVRKPDAILSPFVESFWMLASHAGIEKSIILLPDGRIDVSISKSATHPFHILLMGLDTEASQTTLEPGVVIFAVSFNVLAVEYLFRKNGAITPNQVHELPPDFWGFEEGDFQSFDAFCTKASVKIKELVAGKTDMRKQKLFELIYSSNGAMSVQELSEKVSWSSRQINRYFNQHVGLSLKAYCNILRFRASFKQIKEGKLFPEQNFTDQAHFIKNIKKFAGVVPKELARNKNDRFIQFSLLPEK